MWFSVCVTHSHPYQFFFLSFYYRRVPLNFFVVEMADSHLISPSQLYTRVHSGETRSSPLRYDDMSTILPPTFSPLIAPVRKRCIPTLYFYGLSRPRCPSHPQHVKLPALNQGYRKYFHFQFHFMSYLYVFSETNMRTPTGCGLVIPTRMEG